MIELQLKADRGSFHLDLACTLDSPWSVIFGPSGAGKSTLLRIIAGLESPDSGHILLGGKYLTDIATGVQLRPGKRSTGMVAQQSALFPHLTVTENIAYGITHILPHRRKERIGLMLELVGGKELASRMPSALSGGEAQRVSLARALAPMPRLLLLDEPLSALDAAGRDEILERLQLWLNTEKIQAILVTHDAADALATGAEVVSMHEGKLTGLGPAHLVLADERNRLLARLQNGPATE